MPVSPSIRRHLTNPMFRRRWLAALSCLALSFVPMVGSLGYFSCLLLSPALGLLCTHAGLQIVERARAQQAPAPNLAASAGPLAREWLILCAIPLLALTVGQLWTRTCDYWGGLSFYLLGPVMSGLVGVTIGACAARLGASARQRRLLAYAPFVGCLTVGLLRLYADPVIFAFDPYWGWFSGPIYDEAVAVDARYWAYRGYNLLALVAVVALTHACSRPVPAPGGVDSSRRLALGIGLAAAAVALWIGLRAGEFEFTATQSSLAEHLGAVERTEHFEIHYAPGTATAREIELIAAEHEFAWHRLASRLQAHPQPPIHSYMFASRPQKRRLFGAGRTEVAPPWRGHLYLNHHPFPHRILHHELAHAFSKSYGDAIFGISLRGTSINGGLLEGFATALAPRPRAHLDLHDQAAILDRLEKRPEMQQLMGPGFWASSPSRAYTSAGSFSAWLLELHGAEQLGRLYGNGGDFEAVYGRPLQDLEAEWVNFLRQRPLAQADIDSLAERFRRRSIFARPCAHKVGTTIEKVNTALLRGDAETAVHAAKELCELEPGQPNHLIRWADTLGRLHRWQDGRTVVQGALGHEELTSSMRALLLERVGDLSARMGDHGAARAAYDEALQSHILGSARRRLQLKATAQSSGERALMTAMSVYFDNYALHDARHVSALKRLDAATQISGVPGYESLGYYLRGLQMAIASDFESAANYLRISLSDAYAPLTSPELRWSAQTRLLTALTATRAYDEAQELWREMTSETQHSGHLVALQLWRERIEFFREYRPAELNVDPSSPASVQQN